MAAAEVASRPSTHKRPFASWVKRLTNLNKSKKASKNNPYPQSSKPQQQQQQQQQQEEQPSDVSSTNDYATPPSHPGENSNGSFSSLPSSRNADGAVFNSSRSAAPTVATMPETIHSDAGYSRALTGTTAGGALSSIDGAGANSTFSSPNQSTHSLTTTLTTIQSSNALTQPANLQSTTQTTTTGASPSSPQVPVHFTHQYPVTSQPASAIPSHLQTPAPSSAQQHQPTTYASATAHNLLTDNASILTLASSTKRRRRSFDTDASVRAIPPHSVWGDSRESLPLSVLSGNTGTDQAAPLSSSFYSPSTAPVRPTGLVRDERASVYSNPGVSAPALASERNSFYASSHKTSTLRDKDAGADGRSVRSVHIAGPATEGSLRGYEGSIRSGALGNHGRNESTSGSPIGSPSLLRRPSGAISLDVRDDGLKEGSVKEEGEQAPAH